MTLNLTKIPGKFPALHQHAGVVFLDNPGSTQIAYQSLDRVTTYVTRHNANHSGTFPYS
jgi:selenocysteine lyase/cysteine desulfurase